MRATWLLALPVLCVAAAAPAQPAEPLVDYVVQAGDSCWSIAERLFGDGARYDLVHRHNDLGPLPHLLEPGRVLKVPASVGQPDAKVGIPRHEVRARAPTAEDWRDAYPDMALWRLFRVATGVQSSAEIRFRDLSSLVLRENALLVIHGGTSDESRLQRRVKTTVDLEKGTVYGGLERLDRESDLTIHTPAAEVDLLATLAQVSYEEDQCARVSVFAGQAQVAAQGRRVQVPQEFGTAVPKGHVPETPRPLPPRVAWADPSPVVVRVPGKAPGTFEVSWKPVEPARRYRVELARDEAFKDLVADAVVGVGILRFRAEDLPQGDYRARVSAIDARGLQGLPSAPMAVRVSGVRASARLEPAADAWEVAGPCRIEPPADRRAGERVRVDGGDWRPADAPLVLVEPGLHRVEWDIPGAACAGALAVRVLEVRGRLETPEGVRRPGDRVEVRLRFVDERGRPAWPLGLVLEADPGGVVPTLHGRGPGEHVATIEVPGAPPGDAVRLRATWPGGAAIEGAIEVAPAVPSAGPRPVRWPMGPPRPEWGRTVPGLAAGPLQPASRLGIAVFASAAPANRVGEGTGVRGTLGGEAALAGQRLAVSADVGWLDADATGDLSRRAGMGDLRLGTRYVALEARGFRLGPRFRLVVPTSRRGDPWRLEPGVSAEWSHREEVAIGLGQTFGLGVGGDDPRDVASTTSAWLALRPWRFLEVSVGVDAVMGIAGRDRPRAVLATGAVSAPLGAVRVGAHAGGGVNRDGRDLAGDWTAGLHLEVGFPGGAP